MANRKRYVVQNGTVRGGFTKSAIDEMKMLNMITFRGTRRTAEGTIYVYTPSFDTRKPVGL